MSYNTLLEQGGVTSEYLVIIHPRRKVTGFTLYSGNTYYLDFSYGRVSSVRDVFTLLLFEFPEAATLAGITTNQWFFDESANRLYLNLGGSDPNLASIYVSYEMLFATTPLYWHRDPLDVTTLVSFFEASVKTYPSFKATTSDTLFGYMPVQTSSLELFNDEQALNIHFYDSSFSRAKIEVYHFMGELSLTNMRLVSRGVCGNVTLTDSEIRISVLSGNEIFSRQYVNRLGFGAYLTGTIGIFNDIDPNYDGKPARAVFGKPSDIVLPCISVDFVYSGDIQPNRAWYVHHEQSDAFDLSLAVTNTGSNTVTRTYLSSVDGLEVGDRVWADRATGTDAYPLITFIDTVSKYIDHENITSPLSSTSDRIKRSFVSRIYIVQDGVKYEAYYGRDFLPIYASFGGPIFTGYTQTVKFNDSLESNTGIPNIISPADYVYATVYGLYGNGYTYLSYTTTGVLVSALLEILIENAFVSPDEIDWPTFVAVDADTQDKVGFCVPSTWSDDYPDISSVINKILQTGLLKLFINSDGKWSISKTAPFVTASDSVSEEDLISESFEYELNYSDVVSAVQVSYNQKEFDESSFAPNTTFEYESAFGDDAIGLHDIEKSFSIESLHNNFADATALARRILFVLGDRRGIIRFNASRKLIGTNIHDEIGVNREKLPGFVYSRGSSHLRNASIQGFDKTKDLISLELDDQKGVEDNSGSW